MSKESEARAAAKEAKAEAAAHEHDMAAAPVADNPLTPGQKAKKAREALGLTIGEVISKMKPWGGNWSKGRLNEFECDVLPEGLSVPITTDLASVLGLTVSDLTIG